MQGSKGICRPTPPPPPTSGTTEHECGRRRCRGSLPLTPATVSYGAARARGGCRMPRGRQRAADLRPSIAPGVRHDICSARAPDRSRTPRSGAMSRAAPDMVRQPALRVGDADRDAVPAWTKLRLAHPLPPTASPYDARPKSAFLRAGAASATRLANRTRGSGSNPRAIRGASAPRIATLHRPSGTSGNGDSVSRLLRAGGLPSGIWCLAQSVTTRTLAPPGHFASQQLRHDPPPDPVTHAARDRRLLISSPLRPVRITGRPVQPPSRAGEDRACLVRLVAGGDQVVPNAWESSPSIRSRSASRTAR
jgi:hypothetical protein